MHHTDILVEIDELRNNARLNTVNTKPKFELRMHKDVYNKFNHAISWMPGNTKVSDSRQVLKYCEMDVIVDNSFPLELAVLEVTETDWKPEELHKVAKKNMKRLLRGE